MGWIIEKTGQTVDGNTLKKLALQGGISKTTRLTSVSKQKTVEAKDIAGLVFKEDLEQQPDSFVDESATDDFNLPPVQLPPAVPSQQEPNFYARPSFDYKPKSRDAVSRVGFFDFGFEAPITPLIASWLWMFWVIGGAIAGLVLIALYFLTSNEPKRHAVALVVTVFSVYFSVALIVRITLEAIVVFFKIAEYLRRIANK